MMMMAVMAREVQSRLQAISQGRGAFNDPTNRQTRTQTQRSIAYFLFVAFTFFFLAHMLELLDFV